MVAVQYVLLPVLAQGLGLSYTQIGVLKATSSTAMACLEIPSGFLAEKFGEKKLLIAGLVGVGVGYIGVAQSSQFLTVCLFFLLAGCGAAFQHSLSSALLVRQFEGGLRRRALGTYNAFGDVGKLAYAAAFSVPVGMGLAWNIVVLLLATTVLGFGVVVWLLLNDNQAGVGKRLPVNDPENDSKSDRYGWGIRDRSRFLSLGTIVFLDGIVQAVFLTFIGFVLIEKGASADHAAGGVVLTLIGGTAGKFAVGLLAARLGDRRSFYIVQLMTVAGLLAVLNLPLSLVFIALPLAGIVVQGSSTVYYGAVADHVDDKKSSRAYAIIYTLSSAASVAGPFCMGVLADRVNLDAVIWALIVITVLTLFFAYAFVASNVNNQRNG